jgi:hypothetical protein
VHVRQSLKDLFRRRPRWRDFEHTGELSTYRAKAEQLGLRSLYLFLSFDCDTPEDADVVEELAGGLRDRGLAFTLSVPGQTLIEGSETYAKLASQGVEFINHGFAPHAVWHVDRYVSQTFYRDMNEIDIVDDIARGHAAVEMVTGQVATGFRTPHFGTFQDDAQLRLIHETIRGLGYRYSTSTLPSKALAEGPIVEYDGVFEVPLSGSISAPTTVIDSWTNLVDKSELILGKAYFERVAETLRYFVSDSIPGVFSLYADPSHVIRQEPFWQAMDLLESEGIPSLQGSEVIGLLNRA